MMTALTSEQEQAVARRNEPLLLAAGAGSGKTSVLVERFVRAVREDGLPPGRILAITFTERAAGELRERVRRRLQDLGERQAARDTEAAFVGTFHGFCARLLRAHPLMAGLDPQFTILDERLAARMRKRAFSVALRDFLLCERTGAVDLLAAYGADRVRTMLEGVHAELRSRGRRRPRLPVRVPVGPEVEGAEVCALLGELLEGFDLAYEALKHARGAVDFDDLELGARELLDDHETVRAAWSERFEMLMVDEFQDTNPRQLAILRALDRGNLFTVGDELQSIYGFRHADVTLFRARRAELAGLGRSTRPVESEESVELLVRDGSLRLAEPAGSVRLVARRGGHRSGEPPGSVEPGQRVEPAEPVGSVEGAEPGGNLELAGNFRSQAPLLAVVNAVFEERFGAGYTPLVAGREDARGGSGEGGSEPLVELLLTAKRGWEDGGDAGADLAGTQSTAGLRADVGPAAGSARGGAPRWRQAEARMLAERVAELVESGEARAGEVAVLLRAVGDLEVYERALQQRGLRTLAAVGGFWAHQQVGDLLAYLRALANPLDEPALYATLASPLVGCSSDGLALIARAAHARGTDQVWETVRGGAEQLDARLPAADRAALAQFRARFQEERSTASRRTISQLIERAIDASGYREHALGLEWGERRLANIHKLLRLARGFEASEGRDLRGFLDYAADLQSATSLAEPEAPVAGVEPDAVRLMSIHAAKGLEFPVVCIADLGRAQNTTVPDLLLDGDRVGLRLVGLDGQEAKPSLDFEQLSEERRRAQAEEEDRILYVAMTRARERLLLSGAVDFERWPEQRQGAPTISWLGPALAADLPAIVRSAQQPALDLAVGADGGASVRCRLNTPETARARLRSGAPGQLAERTDRGTRAAPGAGPLEPSSRSVRVDRAPATASGPAPLEEIGTFSYTTLSELERCGYRYYLERVLCLPENTSAGSALSTADGLRARARGTLVHRLLESVDFARPTPPSSKDVARVARELGLRVGRGEREEIAGLLRGAFISAAPAERVAAAEHVRREHPFAFSLGEREPLITGVIDLLAREADGGWMVLDYKSDRVRPDEDLDELVERDYGAQRLLYALAVLRDGAAKVEIVHWFLARPLDRVAARYTAADMGELEERLAERIERARGRSFTVSERPHRGLCLTCPGRAGLCSWSDAETQRETSLV
jgi:ATP-dependent helicase/nuclease subunit A